MRAGAGAGAYDAARKGKAPWMCLCQGRRPQLGVDRRGGRGTSARGRPGKRRTEGAQSAAMAGKSSRNVVDYRATYARGCQGNVYTFHIIASQGRNA